MPPQCDVPLHALVRVARLLAARRVGYYASTMTPRRRCFAIGWLSHALIDLAHLSINPRALAIRTPASKL